MKPTLDFDIIESGNKKTIVFLDSSEYPERPGNPLFEVKFPSISEIYKILIRPKEVNSINTKLLEYSTDIIEFPDGLYSFRYSIDPNATKFVCKDYMRFTKAKCKIKELLLSKDIDTETINKLYKLDIYIQAAEELADSDKLKAMEYFDLVQKELKKIDCDK